ncbi:hypothetical protein LEP1GSC062_2408 [Leptospira alexanderi serovar Manhao 3 str. L 60]|uniref:Uncharacterized protein n=1 Tax=Leptospira alexanderi serovar Manhao 3 str. L 60 TaxID=1049759 RepID=V6I8L9_9LEPT|nr:hypothetical protein LEP1GSC062_2408 [Leptospira alexanderi serovar Manhao 3 str. L 60]
MFLKKWLSLTEEEKEFLTMGFSIFFKVKKFKSIEGSLYLKKNSESSLKKICFLLPKRMSSHKLHPLGKVYGLLNGAKLL